MHYNQTVLLDILEQIYKMTSKKKIDFFDCSFGFVEVFICEF